MTIRGIDQAWLRGRVAEASAESADSAPGDLARLRELLVHCAEGFCHRRPDVLSDRLVWPRRGLGADEARSFLRAVEHGIAKVDDAGYVTLPALRAKTPAGRYALPSKSGDGVSVNLEYLIQIGATAELVLDHGWPLQAIDFERGEFDALGVHGDDRVALAMEAKARVAGPDSLEKLVATWLHLLHTADADLATNAGRKFREMVRLTQRGRVLCGWSRTTPAGHCGPTDSMGLSPSHPLPHPIRGPHRRTRPPAGRNTRAGNPPFDPSLHRSGTAAHDGHCSWHGPVSCSLPPVISFRDRSGDWQSGCQRAVDELTARGEIAPPAQSEGGS